MHNSHMMMTTQTDGNREGETMAKVEVQRNIRGRNWDVTVNREIHEGGFFSYSAALMAAQELRRELANA